MYLFKVVLADGRAVEASSTSNPDLFWALKGGSNNFGKSSLCPSSDSPWIITPLSQSYISIPVLTNPFRHCHQLRCEDIPYISELGRYSSVYH